MSVLGPIREDLKKLGIHDHLELALLVYLTFVTRLMKETLYVILAGGSSAGKSFIVRTVLKLIPLHEVIEIALMTRAGFLRMLDLTQKAIFIHEHLEDKSLAAPFRLLASEGRVPYYLCQSGALTVIELKGPVAMVETTTKPMAIDFENRNRGLLVNVEPTPAELEHRYELIKEKWTHTKGQTSTQEVIQRHERLQNSLRPDVDVIIPFAPEISFASAQPHAQRFLENIFGIIAAIAFLDQANRDHKSTASNEQYIEATLDDYAEAYGLIRKLRLDTGDDLLPEPAWQLFRDLKMKDRFTQQRPFTRVDVVRELKSWTPKTVRQWIESLVDADLLVKNRGKKNRYEYLLTPAGRDLRSEEVFRSPLLTLPDPSTLSACPRLPEDVRAAG